MNPIIVYFGKCFGFPIGCPCNASRPTGDPSSSKCLLDVAGNTSPHLQRSGTITIPASRSPLLAPQSASHGTFRVSPCPSRSAGTTPPSELHSTTSFLTSVPRSAGTAPPSSPPITTSFRTSPSHSAGTDPHPSTPHPLSSPRHACMRNWFIEERTCGGRTDSPTRRLPLPSPRISKLIQHTYLSLVSSTFRCPARCNFLEMTSSLAGK